MDKRIAYIITIVLCFLLEAGIAPAIAIGGCSPNFLMIPIVFIAARSGAAPGSVAGFLLGLLWDLMGSGIIGCMAFVCTIVGLIVGGLCSNMETKSPLVLCIFGIASAFVIEFGYGISVALASSISGNITSTMLTYAAPSALYSAVIMCIALVLLSVFVADDSPNMSSLGRPVGGSGRNVVRMQSRLK